MTPLYIVEEHHEAFIVWNHAIKNRWVPQYDNVLFHVDEHSDMGTPRFNASIHDLNDCDGMGRVRQFTYDELNIASFITPACYQKILKKVYWFKQKHNKLRVKPVKMFVRSYNQSGKRLIVSKSKNEKMPDDADRVEFDYYLLSEVQMPSDKKVILDIDLDYFSCAGDPNAIEEIFVEITEEEYDSFADNKYHRLNYVGVGRIEAVKKDGRFYYVINNFRELYPSSVRVENDVIVDRIRRFADTLKANNIKPLMIDICRSRFSGYTPPDQWEFIESHLLDELSAIYKDMKVIDWKH